ncbi:MAG: hypothetical protein AVDCRST_MAG10-1919, partial [uncultured Acidimicrobiales bacterium]
ERARRHRAGGQAGPAAGVDPATGGRRARRRPAHQHGGRHPDAPGLHQVRQRGGRPSGAGHPRAVPVRGALHDRPHRGVGADARKDRGGDPRGDRGGRVATRVAAGRRAVGPSGRPGAAAQQPRAVGQPGRHGVPDRGSPPPRAARPAGRHHRHPGAEV